MVAGGGIGGNLDLVRRNWPRGYGRAAATMIAGVPDYVDGSMLEVATRAGGRVINPDRMWHYPEGIVNHSPLWTHHGIRILPGPSVAVAGRARADGCRRRCSPVSTRSARCGTSPPAVTTTPGSCWTSRRRPAEFALSGSEQNGDLTGKDLRLLAGRVRPGPTPEVQAFQDRGVDFLTAATPTSWRPR